MIPKEQHLAKIFKCDKISTQDIQCTDTPCFGDDKKHKLKTDIYDGFAMGVDKHGQEYAFVYARKAFMTDCKEISATVREFNGLSETEDITSTHILMSYSTINKVDAV